MPKRTDIKSILIIGSGPIVIGQACEFDYSGTQACKALREEGYRVILVNSNPATIMTDPEMADRTYIEPITVEAVAKIIAEERPDALLPTMGGQTALNTRHRARRQRRPRKVRRQNNRRRPRSHQQGRRPPVFKERMEKIGLDVPKAALAKPWTKPRGIVKDIGLPCIIRPSFTLGGTGGGIAYNMEEFETIAGRGLDASPIITEVLMIEESSSAGKNMNWKSCATARTTWSSSVRSRISTRWACTPATPSPSRPRRR